MVIIDDKITIDNCTNESKYYARVQGEECEEKQRNVIEQDILAPMRDNPPFLCLNQQQSPVPSSSAVSGPSSV